MTGAYEAWDARESEARDRELRHGTCGQCRFSFNCQAGGCVCLWDPLDPFEADPGMTAADAGCEEWEAA